MDAVSDRDYCAELVFAGALCFVHLSRLAEELVLWTSAEYGFAQLDDSAATGSSIMPQKKNPDAAELARGKAGTAIGRLAGLLATLKGMPLAYNRDLQEDKAACFDQVDDLLGALAALRVCISGLRIDPVRMAAAASDGVTVATDLAEQLVLAGNAVPARARRGGRARGRRGALRLAHRRRGGERPPVARGAARPAARGRDRR